MQAYVPVNVFLDEIIEKLHDAQKEKADKTHRPGHRLRNEIIQYTARRQRNAQTAAADGIHGNDFFPCNMHFICAISHAGHKRVHAEGQD